MQLTQCWNPTVEIILTVVFSLQEPSGVLLFSSGKNQDYLVVELFEGKLYIQFNTGADRPLRVTTQQKVNDDRWHAVTIQRTAGNQRQFLLTLDGVTSSVSYAGKDGLDLQGPLYIGMECVTLLCFLIICRVDFCFVCFHSFIVLNQYDLGLLMCV